MGFLDWVAVLQSIHLAWIGFKYWERESEWIWGDLGCDWELGSVVDLSIHLGGIEVANLASKDKGTSWKFEIASTKVVRVKEWKLWGH